MKIKISDWLKIQRWKKGCKEFSFDLSAYNFISSKWTNRWKDKLNRYVQFRNNLTIPTGVRRFAKSRTEIPIKLSLSALTILLPSFQVSDIFAQSISHRFQICDFIFSAFQFGAGFSLKGRENYNDNDRAEGHCTPNDPRIFYVRAACCAGRVFRNFGLTDATFMHRLWIIVNENRNLNSAIRRCTRVDGHLLSEGSL